MIWEQRVPTVVMLTRIFEGKVSRSVYVLLATTDVKTLKCLFCDIVCYETNGVDTRRLS